MANTELDVRPLRTTDKRPAIFATYAGLPVGGSFVLINNRDSRHVHQELEADYAGNYGWQYIETGPAVWRIRISKMKAPGLPQVLTNTADIADSDIETNTVQVGKKSDVGARGLDWNVITLAPNGGIDTTPGADVDVLIHVLFGSGWLTTKDGTMRLAPGALLWLPRRSRPQFSAGPDGLRYLTVNQKWQILPPSSPTTL
ncbi:DUF2249 domain-containing protein [Mycobacterium colombiense]|uniref:DUF2249 domain-containing protein n=1 Tax=Mycobacterium [tuberculosis] TKK-01-0051 TaxID=1324261 RepID=A0A051TV73_9MYCO|nr:DUF2249 domain-containing protein [Mycobacterium colombiense]KBZ60867.1 hypothetical protein K875_03818 [Mycobacterium [tuberculosis] TKK-01-0051]MCK8642242.1 DUF2249 domain-containing protein [Mycobacterium colombiense]